MNDTSSTYDYVSDFYGSSATWFAIYLFCILVFVIASNTFILVLTLTLSALRNNSANWLLFGFSLTDLLHCSAGVHAAYSIWFKDRHACYISGLFALFTGTVSFGFPAIIAADRFYTISSLPGNRFSIGKALFSKRMIVPIIFGWYGCAFLFNLPLLLNRAYGEDPTGFCGAKRITSVGIMMCYEMPVSVFAWSLLATTLYYYRFAKWLKRNQAIKRNFDATAQTRA